MNNSDDSTGWKELGRTNYNGTDASSYFDTTGTFNAISFTIGTTTGNTSYWNISISDNDWMPYKYVEYEPKWHKKFARYKLQMQSMWD